MVPHEAFACSCAEGDVVLRQSYKLESYGKLYYACPKSKPPKHFGCGFFLWKDTRLCQLMSSPGAPSTGPSTPLSYSSGPKTPLSYSSGPSTPLSYSLGSSRNAECSNCKHLHGKISVLKATMEMHMHPEQHTVNLAALFHEVLNEMEKLDLE
ncbi:RNA-directed DNA polymerase, eukaryota, reverse transcriptase zinc-binding domain protein [Tanacetum coccineum]